MKLIVLPTSFSVDTVGNTISLDATFTTPNPFDAKAGDVTVVRALTVPLAIPFGPVDVITAVSAACPDADNVEWAK